MDDVDVLQFSETFLRRSFFIIKLYIHLQPPAHVKGGGGRGVFVCFVLLLCCLLLLYDFGPGRD